MRAVAELRTHHFPSRADSATALISNINLFLIFRQYRLPVNLLRRRRQPIGARPLLIRHHHTIDDLNACQPTLSACVLELFEDDAVEFLVVGEFSEIAAFDAVLICQFLEGGLGGHDDSDGLLFVGVGVAADVGDDGGGTVD